jgi:cellulose biosynthesis protein BcsQ
MFAEHERSLQQPITPFFLLNGFDSKAHLHLEMWERLQHQLGDQLLPFFIPRSDDIAAATADGMTVVDFAPGSLAAKAYSRLTDWIRRASQQERFEGERCRAAAR